MRLHTGLKVGALTLALVTALVACDGEGEKRSLELPESTQAIALVRSAGVPNPPAARLIAAQRTSAGVRVAYGSVASAVALRAGFEAGAKTGGYTVTQAVARAGGGFNITFEQNGRRGTVVIGSAVAARGGASGSGGSSAGGSSGSGSAGGGSPSSGPSEGAGYGADDTWVCVITLEAAEGDDAAIEETVEEVGDEPGDYEDDYDEGYFRADLFDGVDFDSSLDDGFFDLLFVDISLDALFDAGFFAGFEFDEDAFLAGLFEDGFEFDGFDDIDGFDPDFDFDVDFDADLDVDADADVDVDDGGGGGGDDPYTGDPGAGYDEPDFPDEGDFGGY